MTAAKRLLHKVVIFLLAGDVLSGVRTLWIFNLESVYFSVQDLSLNNTVGPCI